MGCDAYGVGRLTDSGLNDVVGGVSGTVWDHSIRFLELYRTVGSTREQKAHTGCSSAGRTIRLEALLI